MTPASCPILADNYGSAALAVRPLQSLPRALSGLIFELFEPFERRQFFYEFWYRPKATKSPKNVAGGRPEGASRSMEEPRPDPAVPPPLFQ